MPEILAHHPDIIPSNWHQLKWAMDDRREAFGVLRDTFPPELIKK